MIMSAIRHAHQHIKPAYAVGVCLFTLVVQGVSQDNPYRYREQKKLRCEKAAVVSAHPLASMAGLQVMQQGGNAFDAAIATQLALAVVYPGAGNLGGGGFLVAYQQNGSSLALDYREKAPSKAHAQMYLDAQGNVIPALSTEGHLAAGIPGTPAGLAATLPYAKLPLHRLAASAIRFAEKGFAITARQAQELNQWQDAFRSHSTRPTAFVRNRSWQAGDTLIQPELAATLRRLVRDGLPSFYTGITAKYIAEEMQRGKGWITLDDLRSYRCIKRKALRGQYRSYPIVTMPLPSSGGIILLQVLGMLEHHPLQRWGFMHPATIHYYIEACRRAFADRASFLGDADFVRVPVNALLRPSYIASRGSTIHPYQADSSRAIGAGTPTESEETTHISIVDRWGNAVAVTTTLNGSYGSYTVVGGAGFLLNNEMDDFSTKPGVPNMYGAIGSTANAIAPGKRMLSSMTPTIVLKNNQPWIITGTPGGTTIPTTVIQTLIQLIDFQRSPEEVVQAPRIHHQWLPDRVDHEAGIPPAILDSLRLRGHRLQQREQIGRLELIQVTQQAGKRWVDAVADRRGNDDARGY